MKKNIVYQMLQTVIKHLGKSKKLAVTEAKRVVLQLMCSQEKKRLCLHDCYCIIHQNSKRFYSLTRMQTSAPRATYTIGSQSVPCGAPELR